MILNNKKNIINSLISELENVDCSINLQKNGVLKLAKQFSKTNMFDSLTEHELRNRLIPLKTYISLLNQYDSTEEEKKEKFIFIFEDIYYKILRLFNEAIYEFDKNNKKIKLNEIQNKLLTFDTLENEIKYISKNLPEEISTFLFLVFDNKKIKGKNLVQLYLNWNILIEHPLIKGYLENNSTTMNYDTFLKIIYNFSRAWKNNTNNENFFQSLLSNNLDLNKYIFFFNCIERGKEEDLKDLTYNFFDYTIKKCKIKTDNSIKINKVSEVDYYDYLNPTFFQKIYRKFKR
ncbi:hypothetical protein HOK00_04230 [bacterium]|nr:hypothetical protein [bacterium]